MLNNKKFNIILSLVLAVSMWIYVVGEVNPTSETTIKNVPISFTNLDILDERGLAMSSSSAEAIDVQIKGPRSELGRITKDDIKITADMGALSKGENEVRLEVRVPDGTEVTRKSMGKIVVTVESLKTKEVPVRIDYDGVFEKDQEPLITSIEKSKMKVSGAESLVNSVTEVKGTINASDIGEEEQKRDCELAPVDSNGNEVNHISLEQSHISVTTAISKLKEVELKVPVVDNSDDDTERTIEKPEKIIIKGKADTLKDIKSVTAEPVDLTNLAFGDEVELKLNLPEGITLSEKNSRITVKVKTVVPEELTFKFSKEDIVLDGKLPEYKYSIPDDFTATVIVSGKKDALSEITRDDIQLSLDVSDIGEGSSKIQLAVKCSKTGVNLSVNPETASVTVVGN